jgi:hypothetical protein
VQNSGLGLAQVGQLLKITCLDYTCASFLCNLILHIQTRNTLGTLKYYSYPKCPPQSSRRELSLICSMSQQHKKQSTTDRGADVRHIKCNIYAYICVSVPYSSYPDCVYTLEIMMNILDVNLTLPPQPYIFPSFPTLCKSCAATPALHLYVGVSASKFLSRFDNLLGCCLGAR